MIKLFHQGCGGYNMDENNKLVEKTLHSNYYEVQIKELEIEEKSKVLLDSFSKNTATHLKNLNIQQKEVVTQKKQTKIKFKKNLDNIVVDYNKHLEDISKNMEQIINDNLNEIEIAKAVKESEVGKHNKVIEEFEKENVKETESILNRYKDEVQKCTKEKEQTNNKVAAYTKKTKEKLENAKEKHLEKVCSLNEKKDTKIDKITESNVKKITKVKEEIVNEESKITKSIEEQKQVFAGRLSDMEEKIAEKKMEYDTKYSGIKATLESKAARHEKFIIKNIDDNDPKAAKQHKKEIEKLQKNKAKELKLITGEHSDRVKAVESKRRILIKENLESISLFTKSLIKFREEKLYLIEMHKVMFIYNVNIVKKEMELKIKDETNKFNKIERDIVIDIASGIAKQEIDLEKEDDIQVKLKIAFDNNNKVNKVEQERELAIKEKELKIIKENIELTIKTITLNQEIDIARLDNESNIAEKQQILDSKVNEENEIIEYYNFDFINQSQMSKENLSFQEEIKILTEARANSVLAYEELETSNRKEIKVKSLEQQIPKMKADEIVVVAKINNAYELELVLYDEEREKVSAKDLEELQIYEVEANEVIKNITEKRNALNAKAYRKEIKKLDNEIKSKRAELNNYVRTKRENITANTVLFDKGIEEVNARKEKALQEIEVFFEKELSRINVSIEIVNLNGEEEIKDANDRHLETFERTSLLLQNAQLRNNQLVEETTSYKMSRIQNENDVIRDYKDIFEKQKYLLKEELDKTISNLIFKVKSIDSKNKESITRVEAILETKGFELDKQLKGITDVYVNSLSKQASIHKTNYSSIENKESNQVKNTKSDFNKSEIAYRTKISEIDKELRSETKNFETAKKVVKKNYDLSLSKHLNELTIKLQGDIKTV